MSVIEASARFRPAALAHGNSPCVKALATLTGEQEYLTEDEIYDSFRACRDRSSEFVNHAAEFARSVGTNTLKIVCENDHVPSRPVRGGRSVR